MSRFDPCFGSKQAFVRALMARMNNLLAKCNILGIRDGSVVISLVIIKPHFCGTSTISAQRQKKRENTILFSTYNKRNRRFLRQYILSSELVFVIIGLQYIQELFIWEAGRDVKRDLAIHVFVPFRLCGKNFARTFFVPSRQSGIPVRSTGIPAKAGQFLSYKRSVPLCQDDIMLTLQIVPGEIVPGGNILM